MTKAEIIDRYIQTCSSLVALASRVDEETLSSDPGLNSWGPKQVLAHCAYWDRHAQVSFEMNMPSMRYVDNDVTHAAWDDIANAAAIALVETMPFVEIRTIADRIFKQFVKYLERVPVQRYGEGTHLNDRMAAKIAHHEEHVRELNSALNSNGDGAGVGIYCSIQSEQQLSFLGGKVADYAQNKGWFFGHFMSEPLLRSDSVEVAWQTIPSVQPSIEQEHFHRVAVEINIVIGGWMELNIDGARHRFDEGQFYVIWPESVVSDISTGPDTELIVVKAPSIPGDKVADRPLHRI